MTEYRAVLRGRRPRVRAAHAWPSSTRSTPSIPSSRPRRARSATRCAPRSRKQIAMGRRGFASGNFTAAQQAFDAVLELDPDNESAQGYISYIDTLRRERTKSGQDGRARPLVELREARHLRVAGGDPRRGLLPERARRGAPRRLLRGDPPAALRARRQRRPRRRAAGAGPAAPAARPRGREADRERAPGLPQRGPPVGASTSGAWRCWSIPRTSARAPTSATPSASSRTSSACARSPTPQRGWSSPRVAARAPDLDRRRAGPARGLRQQPRRRARAPRARRGRRARRRRC